ncbi:MAG: hypothetical protein E5299_02102 [Burkholderia gladioli]|nr:MAG: hypothetical protein E5299_02102 [Burkholderia gladioli]
MYRFKTLTGKLSLGASPSPGRRPMSALRVGAINRMADLARPQSVHIA